jgi:spore germination protein KA
MKGKNDLSLQSLQSQFEHSDDLNVTKIESNNHSFVLLYLSSLVDQDKLETKVIQPLTKMERDNFPHGIYTEQVQSLSTTKEAVQRILEGCAIVLENEQANEGYSVGVRASASREVTELVNEKTIFGSHEGFVEDIQENITLIRKRIASPIVAVKDYELGSEAKTTVTMVYIKGIADSNIVRRVEERIQSIDVDYIRSPGDVQGLIEDDVFSPFPQLLVTEDPERTAANLKDEKIALLVQGSPTVFILPATFTMFFQSPDDYMSRWHLGTIYRMIRYFGYTVALILPALYIAIVSFHYEVIPTELVYSFQQSLSYVPFRPILELIGMQIAFEFLREASLRLPPPVAATFGIVGAIVVGTAMVEAGFVSYGGLVIVAITAVGSFVQPNIEMSNSIRILGFPLMILAGVFGLPGIVVGLCFITIHLTRLTTFGTPYFVPFAPLRIKEFKDSVFRFPATFRKQVNRSSKNKRIRGWKAVERKDPY